jgi:hypothetical protein
MEIGLLNKQLYNPILDEAEQQLIRKFKNHAIEFATWIAENPNWERILINDTVMYENPIGDRHTVSQLYQWYMESL